MGNIFSMIYTERFVILSSIVILSQFTAPQAATSRRSGEDAKVVEGDIQSGFEKLIAGTVGFAVWSRKWLQLNICVPGC